MKTFVITGATSGIGRILVERFSKYGKVFAGYRNSSKLKELQDISENIIPFYIDMSLPETISLATEFIKSRTERVDTLINVAGCVVAGSVENLNMEKLRRQFQVNTFSHVQFSQELLPLLYGGRIINISSMASFGIFPFISPYCASKRALDIIFNSLEIETGGRVRVISIKPGVIATPLWEKSVNENTDCIIGDKAYEKEMKFLKVNALKNSSRGLSVQKVADLIVRVEGLKNPKSSYTVGADAKASELFSKLPLEIVNKLVYLGLKWRIKKMSGR